MRKSVQAVLVVVALLAILCLMLRGLVDRMLYYPVPHPEGDWAAQDDAGAQDIWLTAKDGIRLNGWWFPRPDAEFATLFLHGNAGNVTHRIDHAHVIVMAGSAILVIDYRGYGKSNGHPSETGLYLDADAAYDELIRRGYSPRRIVVHGESLGSAVATELASRRRCAGLILESPFGSLRRMAARVLPIVGPLLVHGFDTEKRIGAVHAPLMLIHGDVDEVVPFSQGEAVFKQANQPKTFWRVPGAHHNDLLPVAAREYISRLQNFYESLTVR